MTRSTLATLVAVGFAATTAADDTKLKVKVGDKFPNVPLEAAQIEKAKKDAKELSIADLKGKVVVVFFYPKANTKGCTIESCGFRDLSKDFPEDVVLVGASADTIAEQEKFIKDHGLPYALLADTELKLIKDLGIEMAGRKMPQRVTFVVDREGVIQKIYNQVNVTKHPKEVLEFTKDLAKKK